MDCFAALAMTYSQFSIFNFQFSRHRIIPASSPRVARHYPFDGQPSAFEGPVFLQGFKAVVGACGGIAAAFAEPGRQGDLVKPDEQDQQFSEGSEAFFHIC